MLLSNKVAIVTGGARGIGRAICLALADSGANIVVADVLEDEAGQTAEDVRRLGSDAMFVHTDVSCEDSVKELYGRVLEHFGGVDILINNAGLCRMIPIIEIEVQEWDRVMAVNLRGTFLMSREAMKIMKQKRSGKIINIASAAAKTGGRCAGAHYSASKAGIICFTKSLALQVAPYGINVNAIAPGPTSTEMTEEWGEQVNEQFAAQIPLGHYAEPEDIANAAVFLASEKARFITGEILDVNGGLVMD